MTADDLKWICRFIEENNTRKRQEWQSHANTNIRLLLPLSESCKQQWKRPSWIWIRLMPNQVLCGANRGVQAHVTMASSRSYYMATFLEMWLLHGQIKSKTKLHLGQSRWFQERALELWPISFQQRYIYCNVWWQYHWYEQTSRRWWLACIVNER